MRRSRVRVKVGLSANGSRDAGLSGSEAKWSGVRLNSCRVGLIFGLNPIFGPQGRKRRHRRPQLHFHLGRYNKGPHFFLSPNLHESGIISIFPSSDLGSQQRALNDVTRLQPELTGL